MNENTVLSHSKYIFLVALAIAGLVSLLLMDISYFLGIIVGYIVSMIIFQIGAIEALLNYKYYSIFNKIINLWIRLFYCNKGILD